MLQLGLEMWRRRRVELLLLLRIPLLLRRHHEGCWLHELLLHLVLHLLVVGVWTPEVHWVVGREHLRGVTHEIRLLDVV